MKTHPTRAVLFGILIFIGLNGFGQKDSYKAALAKIDSLLNVSDYSTAQKMALDYLSKKDLTDLERFRFWMVRAGIIRASSRPLEAIEAYETARSYIPAGKNRKLYLSQIQMRFAECYFDIPEYEKAAFHAQESLSLSPDTSISQSGHAINYLILGYVDFRKNHFDSALNYYKAALEHYKKYGHYCDLPLVYTKMARVQNALGKTEKAINYIDQCKSINDSCGIKVYDLLTYETLYEIYVENDQYEKALATYKMVEDLKSDIDYQHQKAEMAVIEKEYEANLRHAEIEALKKVNEKNEVIAAQQNRFLWIALLGIAVLATLSFLLAKSNKRRAVALSELEKLNRNLENEVHKRTAHLSEANINIRQQAESISERNKALTELYYMVTHDLRGPINNLTMLVNLINEASGEEERKQLMSHMAPVLESLSTTANQLLERVDISNLTKSSLEMLRFEDALDKAKKGLEVEIEAVNAQISTDFQEEAVLYSEKYLTSIFHNFLSNALKYTHPEREPRIDISTAKVKDHVIMRFSDNGLGIDLEKYRDKLFQYKGIIHNRPDSKGIGLFMVKTQIIRVGGEIWVESEPGIGTDFFVKFNN